MKFFQSGCVLLFVASVAVPAWAQAPPAQPPPAQTPPAAKPPAAQPPPVRRPARPTATRIIVRNVSGSPIAAVGVEISGGATRDLTTDAQGVATVNLADGSYRIHLEHEGFVTLEREVTIRNAQ